MRRALLLAGIAAVAVIVLVLVLSNSERGESATAQPSASPASPAVAGDPTRDTSSPGDPAPPLAPEQQTVEPRLIVSTPAAPELDGELLEGRVVDTRGSGIASVQIVLCAEDGSIPETRTGGGTDPTGHFSFPGPDRSWQTHAAFESEAHVPRIIEVPAERPWGVVLQALPVIEGQVRDSAGAGVSPPGVVEVRIVPAGAEQPETFKTNLREGGGYRLTGLPPGRWVGVWARAKGYAPHEADLASTLEPDATLVHDVVLDRGLVVKGVVLDEETREPIPFARVWGDGFDYEPYSAHPTTRADAQGRFRLEGFEDQRTTVDDYTFNSFRIVASSETHASSPLNVFGLTPDESGEFEVELMLTQRTSALRGVVFEPDGTTPAQGAFIWGIDAENNYSMEIANLDGSFAFEGLPAGEFAFIVYRTERSADGLHASWLGQVELQRNADEALVVVLRADPATELTGRATNLSGTPLPGVEIRAKYQFNFGGLTIGIDEERTTTDITGRYRLRGLRAGLYTLTASGCSDPDTFELQLQPGERREIDFTAGDCMTVEGWIDLQGAAAAEFEVLLFSVEDQLLLREGEVSADGTFHISEILAGTYELALFRDGTRVDSVPADSTNATGLVLRAP